MHPQVQFSLPDYLVRVLGTPDLPAIQRLLENCADFHLLVSGEPPKPEDAAAVLDDRPPSISPNDKTLFGIFTSQNELVGVLDFVRGYPSPGIWWIGLLLLDTASRGRGLGRQIYEAFERWASQHGVQEIRLGVVERNEKALHFWESLGFQMIDKRPPVKMGRLEQAIFVMAKQITSA